MQTNVRIALVLILEALRQKQKAENPNWNYTFDFEFGRKFTRIVIKSSFKDGPYNNAHAFMFVDNKTGDIYKPDGYTKRAKGVRYNLLDTDSFAKLKAEIDPYGGFLRMK
jgi:hypothetical protein